MAAQYRISNTYPVRVRNGSIAICLYFGSPSVLIRTLTGRVLFAGHPFSDALNYATARILGVFTSNHHRVGMRMVAISCEDFIIGMWLGALPLMPYSENERVEPHPPAPGHDELFANRSSLPSFHCCPVKSRRESVG
jgi:hypothetical protein